MHGSFQQDQFDGGRGGRHGGGMWEAMEHLRSQFDRRTPGTRVGRGDVRQALLSLLTISLATTGFTGLDRHSAVCWPLVFTSSSECSKSKSP